MANGSRNVRQTPEAFVDAIREWRLETEDKLERLVKVSTATVGDAAQANAPKRSGRLRRSRRTEVGDGSPEPDLQAALKRYTLGDRIVITWRAFYAHIQERGGRSRRGRAIVGKRYVERAARQWPNIVREVAKRLARETGGSRRGYKT